MEDQLVSFTTAKLAKEKGFNISSTSGLGVRIYTKKGGLESTTSLIPDKRIDAPTQSLLQKWLREIHHIEVSAQVNFFNASKKLGYIYMLDAFNSNDIHDGKCYDDEQLKLIGDELGFKTYEKALEVGLLQALKLI